MYIRLFFIFFLFFAWGPSVKADEPPDALGNTVEMSETKSSLPNNHQNSPVEVALEVNIVQIVLNDEHRSGVDWAAIVSDFHTAPLKKENDPLWDYKKYHLSYGTLSQDDYGVLLDALDMAGQLSQFPQPPVKVISGTPARLDLDKQNIHVDLLLTRLSSGDLSLRIDPHFAVAATEIMDGEKIPASVMLQSETKVLISDNMTIVIGGFMKEGEITRTRKFPLLGNIPIVGLVFRSQGRLMQKTETVVFLTVRSNAVDAPEEDSTT